MVKAVHILNHFKFTSYSRLQINDRKVTVNLKSIWKIAVGFFKCSEANFFDLNIRLRYWMAVIQTLFSLRNSHYVRDFSRRRKRKT